MSAVGNLDAGADRPEDDDGPDLWGSFGTALRLIVGWFCVAIGVLNLIVELDRDGGPSDVAYLAFHVMLLVGGLTLLGLGQVDRSPGVPGWVAGGVVAGAGMVAAALPATTSVCCMTAFDVRHGWPYTFMARDTGRWHVDSQHLLADLLFWGYAGLLVLVVVSLSRRRAPDGRVPAGAGTHAEARAFSRDLAAEPGARPQVDGVPGGHETPGSGEARGRYQAPARD